MKTFNFELESSELDLRSDVSRKFDNETDGDGPNSFKPYLDPKWPLLTPYRPKNENFQL